MKLIGGGSRYCLVWKRFGKLLARQGGLGTSYGLVISGSPLKIGLSIPSCGKDDRPQAVVNDLE